MALPRIKPSEATVKNSGTLSQIGSTPAATSTPTTMTPVVIRPTPAASMPLTERVAASRAAIPLTIIRESIAAEGDSVRHAAQTHHVLIHERRGRDIGHHHGERELESEGVGEEFA